MNLKNRFKFAFGLLFVIALCATLFVYLDYSMSRVSSLDASLESDSYNAGLEYSGIVQKQFIEEGSYIKTDDPLFEVRSSTLSTAIKNNEIAKSTLLYSVKEDGVVLISAAAAGRVQSIGYRQGAFAPANSSLAVVSLDGKAYISATYKLSSPDYARLDKNSRVKATFPDNKTVEGRVYDISLKTVNNEILTTVRVRFNQNDINNTAFSVGTPLKSTLYFDSDTWYDRIASNVRNLFQPKSN